jgi:hypothetical protein
MTLEVTLGPESSQFLEEQASQLGIAPEEAIEKIILEQARTAQQKNIMSMAQELFDERASAYEALAEGAK